MQKCPPWPLPLPKSKGCPDEGGDKTNKQTKSAEEQMGRIPVRLESNEN